MLYDASQINLGAYVRCSHEEQKLYGYTISAQKEALEAWANENGVKIVEWYIDEGVSARKKVKNRPELQRMINDAEAGKFNKIIFTKLDRYFRSVSEYHDTQKRLETARVDWQAIHEDFDTSTTDGRFKINLYLTLAEQEADRTADRINRVFEYKVQHGQPLSGKQPIGYKIGTTADGKKCLAIDEEKRQIVEDLYTHFETYNSKRGAQAHINALHGLALGYYAVDKMLKEEKYSGHFRGNPAYCTAIIERERWERIQTLLKRNVKKHATNRTFVFAGLMRCTSCGRNMAGRFIKNSHGTEYYYYNCNRATADKICSHVNMIREDAVEMRLLQTLKDELREYILSASVEENTENAEIVRKERAAITRKMEKLKRLYMADMIEFDEYEIEYKLLKSQLDEIAPPEKVDLTAARDFYENVNVAEIYPTLSREDKQALWRSVIKRIDCNDANETRLIFL